MEPISLTASIITIIQLTGTVVNYLNDVKDAPKERDRCAIEASYLFNLLNNLKYRLEETGENRPWYTSVRALAVIGGPFDQYKSALEQLQSKVKFGSGITKVGNILAWNFSKKEINVILSRMDRLKTLVQIALEMDHIKLSQAIKSCVDILHDDNQTIMEDTSAIRKALPTLEISADAVQQGQKCQRHRTITDWISSINFAAQQSDIISRRQEGTGVWFTDSPDFFGWLHGPNQTLFCPGIPGAGKTMIAAIAVDHLWKHVQTQDIGVAYIYCNYKTQTDQSAAKLAATILQQLVQERPFLAEPVANLYDRHADRKMRPSLEEILSALQVVVSNHTKVYVVVDALDECMDHDGSRSQLLSMLRKLQSTGRLRVMITSRFIPEVVQQFSFSPMLEVRASDSDVKRFIEGQTHRLPRCVQRDNELQETIQERISTAVDGMFLLARLHVDSLLDKGTKRKILSTLDGLPKGSKALDEAYQDAIRRIEGQLPGKSTQAKRVLSWITYAQRPLSTGELCHALAVGLGDSELDMDNIPDVEDMVSDCAGLVVVDDESNIIRLVHYTTQEYFERIREIFNPQAQREIASVCLTYLSFDIFVNGASASDEDFETMIAESPFYEYAAMNWAMHSLTVQEEISQSALPFLQHEALITSIHRMMTRKKSNPYGFQAKTTGLHLTARFGLSFLSDELLRLANGTTSINADSLDGYGRTPLSWATGNGHKEIVKLLLARDDIEADSKDNGYGQTPLSRAAENGHELVVKLLLARDDVEADSKDNVSGQTPLSRAAENGHEAVVKLLLARDDVEADSKDTNGCTPLSAAARYGHEAVVKLLLARDDVEVDSKDNLYGRTPLSWAAADGHETVVKLLLARDDVEADLKDENGQTPLLRAARYGYEAIIKLLLIQDKIEADSKDIDGRTPLSFAAEKGHKAVVKLLLARDDIKCNSEVVKLLLAQANAALDSEVVKLLLAEDDAEWDSEMVRMLSTRNDMEWDSEMVELLLARNDIAWDPEEVELLLARDDIKWNSEMVELLLARKEDKAESELVNLLSAYTDIEANTENM
ncbi:MAG: hypothetical protein Q9208_005363 [Pyrenodesmia sp. 3 TL-2023]